MNIYITSGTLAFMETIRDKYAQEMIIAMHDESNALLLHETNGKTVFQTPRRYEVLASSGTLDENGYFVYNHIPVSDEGRPIFEQRFKERTSVLDDTLGFVAYRILRPLDSDTYIVMTEWSASTYYEMWKNSSSLHDAYLTGHTEVGVDNTPHIFTSAPFVTTYTTKVKEADA